MIKRFVKFARWRARRTKLPGAEAVALEALVRAVVTFRHRARSKTKRLKALFRWVRLKIDFALRNLAAEYPTRAVRDAFVQLAQAFGYNPTLKELCAFGPFNPRHVLNVWKEVAQELDLTPATDTVRQSFLDELDGWLGCGAESNPEIRYRTRQVLARLAPGDACLVILKHLCNFSEAEILAFLKDASHAEARGATHDDLEDKLDEFVLNRINDLKAPWHSGLLNIQARGLLAVRLHRARACFRAVFIRLFGSG